MDCLQGWLAKYIAKGSRLWIYRRESFYVQAEKPVLTSVTEYIMDGAGYSGRLYLCVNR